MCINLVILTVFFCHFVQLLVVHDLFYKLISPILFENFCPYDLFWFPCSDIPKGGPGWTRAHPGK